MSTQRYTPEFKEEAVRQIVEFYGTEKGAVRQRAVANLGRLDKLEAKHLDPLISGLNRVLGRAENTIEDYRPSTFGAGNGMGS